MTTKDKVTTIKDIALKAKVSIGTVDRVLHKRGRVAADIEKKVLKIIKESDYHPNIIARTLVSKKEYHVAVLIPHASSGAYWFDAFEGANQAALDLRKYGLTANYFFFNPDDAQSFTQQADLISETKPDIIVLTPVFQREVIRFFELWKAVEIPYICFNNEINDHEPLSYVGQDNYQSGFLAGKLVHYGLCNPCAILIVHVNPETINAAHLAKKEQGFRNYFQQNNLQQFDILQIDVTEESQLKFTRQMDLVFEESPNIGGVFVSNAKAFRVAEYLVQKHIKDVKIVGYDLLPRANAS